MPLVEGRGLYKRYGTGDAGVDAIRGVDLTIDPGELVALMGPSGCGKSTLLYRAAAWTGLRQDG